jgi:proteasome lid subunit RPN8/RPN11
MKIRRSSKSAKEAEIHVGTPAAIQGAIKRAFPGPRGARVPLRVAIDKQAQEDISVHARESPHAEVCGVLVGNVCQDEEGAFTHVTHALRGQGAAEGSTHVTFTQATWTAIHEIMDRDHANRQIVGWYHTHPGFGVEFSDMDTFIQRNFFSGPAQVALVTDPSDGAVARAMNDGAGIVYLDRYWIDGREQKALTPASAEPAPTKSAAGGGAQTAALEDRIAQLTQAVDDLRSWMHGFLLIVGFVVCAGFILFIASVIRDQFRARVKPPELGSYIPLPIKVGDKNVLMGVSVVNWEVPPELHALMLDLAREEAEAAKEAKAGESAETPAKAPEEAKPQTAPTPPPAPASPPAKS